jgi:hypothetical protein
MSAYKPFLACPVEMDVSGVYKTLLVTTKFWWTFCTVNQLSFGALVLECKASSNTKFQDWLKMTSWALDVPPA